LKKDSNPKSVSVTVEKVESDSSIRYSWQNPFSQSLPVKNAITVEAFNKIMDQIPNIFSRNEIKLKSAEKAEDSLFLEEINASLLETLNNPPPVPSQGELKRVYGGFNDQDFLEYHRIMAILEDNKDLHEDGKDQERCSKTAFKPSRSSFESDET
jgi:hypothetical protein